MSDTVIFAIGCVVTVIVAIAVALLMSAAYEERPSPSKRDRREGAAPS